MATTALRPLNFSTAARSFSTSTRSNASVLFALGALSNSRETQHFNKISKLERVEHSPHLKLIKTSEVDPFPVPIERLRARLGFPPASTSTSKTSAVSTPDASSTGFKRSNEASRVFDAKALVAGRAILAELSLQRVRMSRILDRSRRKALRQKNLMQKELAAWAEERRKIRHEMRSAGVVMLLSVGAATGFGLWTFWPEAKGLKDGRELAKKIAEKAQTSILLPAAVSTERAEEAIAVRSGTVPVTAVVTSEPTVPAKTMVVEEEKKTRSGSWWRSLFWKKS